MYGRYVEGAGSVIMTDDVKVSVIGMKNQMCMAAVLRVLDL